MMHLQTMQMTFYLGPCPRYWMLNNALKTFRLPNAFPPPKLPLHTKITACWVVPVQQWRALDGFMSMILLRSDLTRVPLGVWLPQMTSTHSAPTLHCALNVSSSGLYVCALVIGIFVCKTFWSVCFPAVYWFIHKRHSAERCSAQKQFSLFAQ